MADHIVQDDLQWPGRGKAHGCFHQHRQQDDEQRSPIGTKQFADQPYHAILSQSPTADSSPAIQERIGGDEGSPELPPLKSLSIRFTKQKSVSSRSSC